MLYNVHRNIICIDAVLIRCRSSQGDEDEHGEVMKTGKNGCSNTNCKLLPMEVSPEI